MSDQGKVWSAFIQGQLEDELDRKEKLDARGLAVVTTSSVLATLSFGLLAAIAGKDHIFTGGSRWVFALSVIAFLGSSVFGLLTSWLRPYKVAHTETLEQMLREHWTDEEEDARNHIGMLNVATVASLRRENNIKANLLIVAISLQICAVGIFYTASVITVLT